MSKFITVRLLIYGSKKNNGLDFCSVEDFPGIKTMYDYINHLSLSPYVSHIVIDEWKYNTGKSKRNFNELKRYVNMCNEVDKCQIVKPKNQ